jgi:pilus assembly protein CpaC
MTQPQPGSSLLAAGTIVNRVRVPGPRQIMLKVKIAELDRSSIRELGVNFERLTSGDIVRSAVGGIAPFAGGSVADSQLVGIFDEGNFSLYINALRQNDLAKILAEPTLVTMDGQPARFIAGGSFPFPVPQANAGGGTAITIQFQDFGAILQFLPHILDGDVIRLDVEPIFSELNPATGIQILGTAVPGINQRGARTVVELREGQTLAIAGLLQTRTTGTTARIPVLGDIPIVGPWFSRNRIAQTESELLVLVTPELVEPYEAHEQPEAPGDRVQEPNDLEFYFLGRLEGKTGHVHRSTVKYLDPWCIMKHHYSEQRWVVGPHGHSD